MASMTDIIFLLLIFFMITSTMVSPQCHQGIASARQAADFGKAAYEGNH